MRKGVERKGQNPRHPGPRGKWQGVETSYKCDRASGLQARELMLQGRQPSETHQHTQAWANLLSTVGKEKLSLRGTM